MREEKTYEIIDKILKEDTILSHFECEIMDYPEINLDEETIKKKVLSRISTKKNKKHLSLPKSRLIPVAAIITLIIVACISVQANDFIKRGLSFIPGVGFHLNENQSYLNDYMVLRNQVTLRENNGNATIKSAYILDNKLILRIESTKDFLNSISSLENQISNEVNNNDNENLEKLYPMYSDKLIQGVKLKNGNNTYLPEGCSNTGLSDSKVLLEYRFNNVNTSPKTLTFNIEFNQKAIKFEMLPFNMFKKSDIYSNFISKDGIELTTLAVKYNNIIEADLIPKYNNKSTLSRIKFDDNNGIFIKDSNGKIYLPKVERFNMDQFVKDINNKSLQNNIYGPIYHTSFEIDRNIKYPIALGCQYLGFIYNNIGEENKTWLKVNLPNVGEITSTNIQSKIVGIPFDIKNIKRVSLDKIELNFNFKLGNKNKVSFLHAYTFVRYDDAVKSNRSCDISAYDSNGNVKRILVDVDPNLETADILICAPEVAYYGPWTSEITTFSSE